jgi:DNA-directed RNA polymerase specialized sigma24 family protein
MNERELLRRFLQVRDLAAVDSSQERAAFISLRIDGHTVRATGQAIGISKSSVSRLADMFQVKLTRKLAEMEKKGRVHGLQNTGGYTASSQS